MFQIDVIKLYFINYSILSFLLFQTGEMEVKNPLFSEETPVTPTPNGGESSEHGHK